MFYSDSKETQNNMYWILQQIKRELYENMKYTILVGKY